MILARPCDLGAKSASTQAGAESSTAGGGALRCDERNRILSPLQSGRRGLAWRVPVIAQRRAPRTGR